MKRERPSDDIRRLAIKARLQGVPSQEIARHLGLSYHTVRTHLGKSGGVRKGQYHLNALTARALFTERELVELGAVWSGRSWVGPGSTNGEPVSNLSLGCRTAARSSRAESLTPSAWATARSTVTRTVPAPAGPEESAQRRS